jgi:hypothetical protein
VNVETKEQSKQQWMHTHSPNKPKSLSNICQKAEGNCFLGHESNADGGIQCEILKKLCRATPP